MSQRVEITLAVILVKTSRSKLCCSIEALNTSVWHQTWSGITIEANSDGITLVKVSNTPFPQHTALAHNQQEHFLNTYLDGWLKSCTSWSCSPPRKIKCHPLVLYLSLLNDSLMLTFSHLFLIQAILLNTVTERDLPKSAV